MLRSKLRMVVIVLALGVVGMAGVLPARAQETPSDARTEESVAGTVVRTDLRYFLPFGPDGLLPTLTVRQEVTGVCDGESIADIGRPDAWFCIADDGAIYDPCFENPFGSPDEVAELACASAPWDTEVVRFTTTEPLRREKEASDPAAVSPPPGPPAGPESAVIVPALPEGAPAPPAAPGPLAGAPPPDPAAGSSEAEIDPLDIPWALELATGERCGLLTGATAVYAGQRINYGCEGGGSIIGDVQRTDDVWLVNFLAAGAVATTLAEVAVVWT